MPPCHHVWINFASGSAVQAVHPACTADPRRITAGRSTDTRSRWRIRDHAGRSTDTRSPRSRWRIRDHRGAIHGYASDPRIRDYAITLGDPRIRDCSDPRIRDHAGRSTDGAIHGCDLQRYTWRVTDTRLQRYTCVYTNTRLQRYTWCHGYAMQRYTWGYAMQARLQRVPLPRGAPPRSGRGVLFRATTHVAQTQGLASPRTGRGVLFRLESYNPRP